MDEKLRKLERLGPSRMTWEEVLLLAKYYERTGNYKAENKLFFDYNQTLPPLPVIVRRDRMYSPFLICIFPTIPASGLNWYPMQAITDHGTTEVDYMKVIDTTEPVRVLSPEVQEFLTKIENLDGRKVKPYARNTYKFNLMRQEAWKKL